MLRVRFEKKMSNLYARLYGWGLDFLKIVQETHTYIPV